MKRNLFAILCLTLFTMSVSAQITFQKIFESTSMGIGARALKKTTDNGYIIAGLAQDSLNTRYAHLLKIDSSANVLWSKTFISIGNTEVADIFQTSDNGFMLLSNTSQGAQNMTLLIKADSIGDTLWTKSFGGGQDHVVGYSIIQTSDKGFLITGRRAITFSTSGGDIYVFKTDSLGNPNWSKTYSSYMPNSADIGIRSIQLNDGGFMILGQLNYSPGEVGCFLIRLDSSGNNIWSKNITTPNIVLSNYFEQTNDGGFIIAGKIRPIGQNTYDIHLIKTDSTGNAIWSKIYSGGISDEEPYEVHQTSDGGYVVVGYSFSWNHTSSFLIKTDFNGDTLWTKGYGDGTTVGAGGNSVLEAVNGGYLLAGWFSYPLTFSNIHLIKTDTIGNSGGCYEQNHPFIVITPVTLVNATSPDTSSGIIVNSISIVENTLLIQPSTLCPVGIDESFPNWNNSVYPNPFESSIYFSFQKQNIKNVSFSIKNILGQIIYRKNFRNINSQYSLKFDLSFLSRGIYLLDVNVDGERTVKKIVKE